MIFKVLPKDLEDVLVETFNRRMEESTPVVESFGAVRGRMAEGVRWVSAGADDRLVAKIVETTMAHFYEAFPNYASRFVGYCWEQMAHAGEFMVLDVTAFPVPTPVGEICVFVAAMPAPDDLSWTKEDL